VKLHALLRDHLANKMVVVMDAVAKANQQDN
jgi:hypothetical protein